MLSVLQHGALIGLAVLTGAALWVLLDEQRTATTASSTTDDSFTAREAGFGTSVTGAATTPEASSRRLGFAGRYTVAELANYERATDTVRVGLQIGHLRNDEVPTELSNLTRNGPGATWGPYTERAAMASIVELAAEQLRADGITVDVLPATVPPGYEADAFVSVHADGNRNESVRGFKVANFSHDHSGYSPQFTEIMEREYARVTGLPLDPAITYRMTGYYAFNWYRYEHAVHPLTPAIILETGFLTNAADRQYLIDNQQRVADGIVAGVRAYLDAPKERRSTRSVTVPLLPLSGRFTCLEGSWDANDPPSERGAPCRPGILTDDGMRIGLRASSTPSDISADLTDRYASGTPLTVDGTYTPMVGVRDLTWYDFRVRGVLSTANISQVVGR